jgi:hypothetical protein
LNYKTATRRLLTTIIGFVVLISTIYYQTLLLTSLITEQPIQRFSLEEIATRIELGELIPMFEERDTAVLELYAQGNCTRTNQLHSTNLFSTFEKN